MSALWQHIGSDSFSFDSFDRIGVLVSNDAALVDVEFSQHNVVNHLSLFKYIILLFCAYKLIFILNREKDVIKIRIKTFTLEFPLPSPSHC